MTTTDRSTADDLRGSGHAAGGAGHHATGDGPDADNAADRLGTTGSDRRIGQLVFGGVLILIGTLWITERAGLTELSATAVLALGTIVVGLLAMLSARSGAYPGLIAFGLLLAVFTAVSATAPLEGFQGGIGDRTVVATGNEVDRSYELGAGTLEIDLTELDWTGSLDLTADVGFGELIVVVPDGVAVDVTARAGAGEVVVFDEERSGMVVEHEYRSRDFEDSQRRLRLEANVFVGEIDIVEEER